MSKFPGTFISFEGGEKLGKSTQVNLLAESLQKKGFSVIVTREPGGTAFGEAVREMLLNPKWTLSKATEMLLFQAARAQHYKEVLKPALRSGHIVLCDRYVDSSLVYQGHVGGWSLPLLLRLHGAACGMLMPDLTLIFDGQPHADFSAGDSFERRGAAFHSKVRDEFKALAGTHERYVMVDASRPIPIIRDEIENVAWNVLLKRAYGDSSPQ
jgi:dTMP kinase